MTAVLILNIVFAAIVFVGMVSLLGGAIVADRRASGARGPETRPPAVRSTPRARVAQLGRRVDPAT